MTATTPLTSATVHADYVLLDIDALDALEATDGRTAAHPADPADPAASTGLASLDALAHLLAGRTWGAVTDAGLAGAAERATALGLPKPALVLTGGDTPDTWTAAADLLGAAPGACTVLTAQTEHAIAAQRAGSIAVLLSDAPHPGEARATSGILSLPKPSDLTRAPSPWKTSFTAPALIAT